MTSTGAKCEVFCCDVSVFGDIKLCNLKTTDGCLFVLVMLSIASLKHDRRTGGLVDLP